MLTKEICHQDLLARLLKLNFEIMVLEFRAGEASPEIMRACYPHVRVLRAGYQWVEDQVQAIIEGPGETRSEAYSEIDRALQELLRLLDREGSAIRGRLSEKLYFTEVQACSLSKQAKTKTRDKKSILQITVRRRKRGRLKPTGNLIEGEIWS